RLARCRSLADHTFESAGSRPRSMTSGSSSGCASLSEPHKRPERFRQWSPRVEPPMAAGVDSVALMPRVASSSALRREPEVGEGAVAVPVKDDLDDVAVADAEQARSMLTQRACIHTACPTAGAKGGEHEHALAIDLAVTLCDNTVIAP